MPRKKPMPAKHLAYFTMIDACRSKECPICWLVKKQIENYFDTLLYENVNDIGFRNRFRADYGFCNYHTYKFASYNDGLAVALTHRDLLKMTLDGLNTRGNRYLMQQETKGCLVCQMSAEEEIRDITVICDFLHDPEFKNAFLGSEGLCLPHYRGLVKQSNVLPHWLTEFQLRQYAELLQQLERYLESCNFSLGDQRPVLTREESLVWQKVVNMLFGYEGRLLP
jgi:hypothetical protein